MCRPSRETGTFTQKRIAVTLELCKSPLTAEPAPACHTACPRIQKKFTEVVNPIWHIKNLWYSMLKKFTNIVNPSLDIFQKVCVILSILESVI